MKRPASRSLVVFVLYGISELTEIKENDAAPSVPAERCLDLRAKPLRRVNREFNSALPAQLPQTSFALFCSLVLVRFIELLIFPVPAVQFLNPLLK
jgi:hypothetical protein